MVLTVTTRFDAPTLARPIKLREERDNEGVPLRTGCRVWSCARLLSRRLVDAESFSIRGRDVLELGAGVGAVGLVCASLGARSVTLTDRDEAALALMHTNVRLNGYYDATAVSECEVSVERLDWGDVGTYIQPPNAFDYVVAADVLYLPEHCQALPDAAAAHLKPGGRLVVACGLRRKGLMETLVAALRGKGLNPLIDGNALSLESDDVDETTALTAKEHEHDGAQIARAGGYVLVTCDAPEDWKPPPPPPPPPEDNVAVPDPVVSFPSRVTDPVVSFPAEPGGVPGAASPRGRVGAEDDACSLSEVGSDAASAMGDFLDELAELEVGAYGASGVSRTETNAREKKNSRDDVDVGYSSDDASEEYPPFRVPVSEPERVAGAPSEATIRAAADSLRRNGFVVLDPPEISARGEKNAADGLVRFETLRLAEISTDLYLSRLTDRARCLGIDPETDIFRFSEICARARGGRRFDVTDERRAGTLFGPESADDASAMRVPPPKGPEEARASALRAATSWHAIREELEPWITPVLRRSGLMGADRGESEDENEDATNDEDATKRSASASVATATGCVVSLPGAPAQHFHADGRARGIANAFVPLVDVPSDMGPTRFRRGSHAWDHDDPYPDRRARRLADAAEEAAPPLARGSVLLYDYRVMHAGGANASAAPRPLAYVMRSRAGLEDTWNFPENYIWDDEETEGAGEV